MTIPESVTSIGVEAFYGCSSLTSVNITDIVAWCKIDFGYYNANPIYYAHKLMLNGEEVKDLTIPNSVTSIGNYAFYGCSGLTSVTIPNSVTSIGSYAFRGCYGLTSVTIPNSVTSIGGSAFRECSGLTSVTIPESVTSIGDYAFESCSGLTSVTIPESVTSIGDGAFSYCSVLTSVNITDIAAWCKISFGVTFAYPFYCAHKLMLNGEEVKDLVIPESVTSIGNYAFYKCSSLTSVTIPKSVTSIGEAAFSDCSGLTSVTIPESVTSIGDGAFRYCSGLTSVTNKATTMLNGNIFGSRSGITVHVYEGSKPRYQNESGWRDQDIVDDIPVIAPTGIIFSRDYCKIGVDQYGSIKALKTNSDSYNFVNPNLDFTYFVDNEDVIIYDPASAQYYAYAEGVAVIWATLKGTNLKEYVVVTVDSDIEDSGVEVINSAAADKEKVIGTSFTTGEYEEFTHQKSGEYVKMRTGNNEETITISVNEGYVVTGFKIEAYSNNTSTTADRSINLKDITVDDVYTGKTETFLGGTAGQSPRTVELTDIEAKENIILYFDNSKIVDKEIDANGKNKQIYAKITIAYYKKANKTDNPTDNPTDESYNTISITSAGVGTYVTKNALDFSDVEDIKAYIPTKVTTSRITMTEVEQVPAGTAILVKGTTADVPVISSAEKPAINLFQVSDNTVADGSQYILAMDSNMVPGFYKATAGTTIPEGKCFLTIAGVTNSLAIDFEAEETDINNVTEKGQNAKTVTVIENGRLLVKKADGSVVSIAGAIVK